MKEKCNKMNLIMVTVFTPEDEGLSLKDIRGGDYSNISLFEKETGRHVKSFGDYYHNKGDVAAESYLSGMTYAGMDISLWECEACTGLYEYPEVDNIYKYQEMTKFKKRRKKIKA